MSKFTYILCTYLLAANMAAYAATIVVQGQCEVKSPPDRGSITLSMSYLDPKNIDQAIAKLNEKMVKLKNEIKELDLAEAEIQTQNFSAQEKNEWENNKQVFKGYEAREGLFISSSDIKKISKVVSIASKLGIKEMNQLQLFLSSNKQNELQNKCLKLAVENAHEKAQSLAQALNKKLGNILSITEGHATSDRQPIYSKSMSLSESSRSSSIQIEEGTLSIAKTIIAEYSIP